MSWYHRMMYRLNRWRHWRTQFWSEETLAWAEANGVGDLSRLKEDG